MRLGKHMGLCLLISGVILLTAALMSVFGPGLNLGLDFAGGLSMQFDAGEAVSQTEAAALLGSGCSVTVQGAARSEVLVRIKSVDESGVQTAQAEALEKLRSRWPDTVAVGDVSYVGPVAGATLIRNALLSVAIATGLMLVYIAIRFDFNSGLAAVLGLVHDVLIMLAFMVLLRSVVEMNSSFIAAMLTIVGYSINNTIVIFDRIRENAKKLPDEDRVEIVNRSVRESLGRTVNTTLTTLITITALYILGASAIREFALPIIVGIVSGVYSANLINGYVWAALEGRRRRPKSA